MASEILEVLEKAPGLTDEQLRELLRAHYEHAGPYNDIMPALLYRDPASMRRCEELWRMRLYFRELAEQTQRRVAEAMAKGPPRMPIPGSSYEADR